MIVVMGSAAQTVARDRGPPVRAGRAGRRGPGPAVPAVPGRGAARRAAGDRGPDRGARPDQGAGVGGRAAVPRRDRRARRLVCRCTTGPSPPDHRRPLRAVVQGTDPGHGRRGVRGTGAGSGRGAGSRSASPTTCPAPACRTTRRWTSSRPARSGRSSSASARTARSARTRTRSRSSAASTGLHAQGYFVYDSKKSGSQTVSHLRFGPEPIRAPYLVQQASFVGCHQFGLLDRVDVLGRAAPGATLLLNCAAPARRGLGRAAPAGPGEDPGQADRGVRDRRGPDRPRGRAGRADQHGAADLLLRDLRRAAAGRGDRQDQGGDRQDLRAARRRGRRAQPRGGRPGAGGAAPDRGARPGRRPAASCPRWCRPARRSSSARSPRR